MVEALIIIIVVLLIALWISVMLLWWRSEQENPAKTIKRGDVIHAWNKAARLARRSWYDGVRYSKQASVWSNKKVQKVFVAVFPKSKAAFIEQNLLTGLEHGPSSYFLANLTRISRKKKSITRRKKIEIESTPQDSEELSA